MPKSTSAAMTTMTEIGLRNADVMRFMAVSLKLLYEWVQVAEGACLEEQGLPDGIAGNVPVDLGPVEQVEGLGDIDYIGEAVLVECLFLRICIGGSI